MKENIPRVKKLSARDLYMKHIRSSKPVIVEDFFRGQPIEEMQKMSVVFKKWGNIPLSVRGEYFSSILNGLNEEDGMGVVDLAKLPPNPKPPRKMTVKKYFEFTRKNRKSKLISSELPVPQEILSTFILPMDLLNCIPKSEQDWKAQLFVGNAGNVAHLHFDGDFRQVLFYQITGRKRIILFPPEVAQKLLPMRNFSTLFIEHLSEPEKDRLVEYLGGYQCLLEPGEMLFMPASIWHYLEYLDDGISMNLRFGRNQFTRFLAHNFNSDMCIQNIAPKFFDPTKVTSKNLKVFKRIEKAVSRKYSSEIEKYSKLQKLLEWAYFELCPSAIKGGYALSNLKGFLDELVKSEILNAQLRRLSVSK